MKFRFFADEFETTFEYNRGVIALQFSSKDRVENLLSLLNHWSISNHVVCYFNIYIIIITKEYDFHFGTQVLRCQLSMWQKSLSAETNVLICGDKSTKVL